MSNEYRDKLLMVLSAAGMCLALGCSSEEESPGGGGGGNVVTPNEDGWIDASSNSLGIQGAWYTYGDAYGADAKCPAAGWTAEQCSRIDTPDPNAMGYPNQGGVMCTSGSTAQVLTPDGGTDPDYGNMWGSGIGVDLNNPGADSSSKSTWNATANGIVGVAFDIDVAAPVRVEFPMPATEGHADGSNYWGASASWPNSPVVAGRNTVYWTEVTHPNGAVPLDPNAVAILGIQFHVPSVTSGRTDYNFCISNVEFVTQ